MSKRVRQRWDHKGMPLRALTSRHRGTYVHTEVRRVDAEPGPVDQAEQRRRMDVDRIRGAERVWVGSDGSAVAYASDVAEVTRFPLGCGVPVIPVSPISPDERSPEDRVAEQYDKAQRQRDHARAESAEFRRQQDRYFD